MAVPVTSKSGYFDAGRATPLFRTRLVPTGSQITGVSAGYDVAGLAAIFTYGFDVAVENFKLANCPFYTLSNYSALIKYAGNNHYITEADVDVLKKWRENPAEWGK